MMIPVNSNTKIAAIIKAHPGALDAIVSISPKFEKLRNPILRKLMAGRTTIAMASKISGNSPYAFFEKLRPLGFEIDVPGKAGTPEEKKVPGFFSSLKEAQVVELDVRPIIASGKDPLNIITEKLKTFSSGQTLKIINTFEPVPLMMLLKKQGFAVYADVINDNLVETYFYKQSVNSNDSSENNIDATRGWEEILKKFQDRLETIDVRNLEMPLPMMAILEALEHLADGRALFVNHKRIPVYLLPELTERKFDYRIKENGDGQVNLLIFKTGDV
jgi:Domain of unknown function (DUF1858)./Uncharacterized conserved protein (DUF2249).